MVLRAVSRAAMGRERAKNMRLYSVYNRTSSGDSVLIDTITARSEYEACKLTAEKYELNLLRLYAFSCASYAV